jgi:hypothetical protein
MDANSRALNPLSSPTSSFSEQQHLKCLSQITPIVVGVSKIAHLLKASETLSSYSGGRARRRFVPASAGNSNVEHRLHHLRPIEHKGDAINTRVGLGRGWEKMYQGTPVDSPRRKFRM